MKHEEIGLNRIRSGPVEKAGTGGRGLLSNLARSVLIRLMNLYEWVRELDVQSRQRRQK